MSETIDNSGTLTPVNLVGNYVIETDSGTTLTPVVVELGTLDVSALTGFTVQNQATLVLGTGVNASIGDRYVVGPGGVLVIGDGVSASVLTTTSFDTGTMGGTLVLGSGLDIPLLENISGFDPGDVMDFTGTGLPVGTYSDNYSAGMTTFTVPLMDGDPMVFTLAGDLTPDIFMVSPDSSGNGFNFAEVTCFAPGTRILTQDGEVPVENLRVGDMAVLRDDRLAPVTFIGRRDLDLRRHGRPWTVRPVRIAAGALADGIPARDLVLSPDHALYFDGVLVQAKDLVDGVLITQDWQAGSIRYYHVELETHGIIWAEGAAVESYLDTGHRGLFDNSDEPLILHPDLMQIRREAESTAPLCRDGARLAAIRARLHERKAQRGLQVVESTGVALRLDGVVLAGQRRDGQVRFAIPRDASEIVLVAPAFVPAEVDPHSDDRRALGVAISEIWVDDVRVAVQSVVAADGLHERGHGDAHVWTRPEALVRLPPGTGQLKLGIAGTGRLWCRALGA